MKLIAFYLPQYHSIPENDKWWGEGFTEWTNTKKTKPLYNGQSQPREPLNDNYYNLLEDKNKLWQVNLAKEYGIHGFCYYHYWFNGRMVLQKPLEQVLNNKKIDLPFCISWANEPWTRSWDGLTSEILLQQDYGDKNDWLNHYKYLDKFFKDDRYIKVNNKPMVVVYKLQSITNREKMIKCWNELAKKSGFDGIYLVETLNGVQKEACSKDSKAVIQFEPNYTIHHDRPIIDKISNKIKNIIMVPKKGKFIYKTMDYNITWRRILKRRMVIENKKVFPGAFVDWDNTARKGKKALVFNGGNPERFGKYLRKLARITNEFYESEYIFINAWNEWAEGTYLEPDKKNKYGYLEKVKEVIEYTNK
jgi:hypothetical protein